MGLCSSKNTAHPHQGNLLLEGFVRYALDHHHHHANGWTKQKPSSHHAHSKDISVEVLENEPPLGTWRGQVVLDASLEEVLPYVSFKLGLDSLELLADEEGDGSIFRDMFDFSKSPSTSTEKPSFHFHTGDRRGETSERFSDLSLAIRKRTLDEDPQTVSPPSPRHLHSASPLLLTKLKSPASFERIIVVEDDSTTKSPPYQEEDDRSADDDSGDDDDNNPTSAVLPALPNSVVMPSTHNWLGVPITPTALSKSLSKKKIPLATTKETAPPVVSVLPREIILRRQDFVLENNGGVAIVLHSLPKHPASSPKKGMVRCQVRMMGCVLEEIHGGKTPRVRLTYVCAMDPLLTKAEEVVCDKMMLSRFGGKLRVESFLLRALECFESPTQKLILKFRYVAGANTGGGELQWREVDRTKNELQLGTNVTHKKYGHGIVQSFDMKGRVRVVYDNKEVVDHSPEEKNDLNVSVLIGTRVKHRTKGLGTVKAFDENGRVHVKFDNGNLHRYKQEAWKKKMHTVKLTGIGGALGTVKLSWRPHLQVREGMGRIRFAVGVSTESVLEYILENNTQSSVDDIKSGSILERRVLERVNVNERVIYEHRRMPPPLTSRDFVFRELWEEVAPKTFVVVYESVRHVTMPEKPQTVRGELFLTGYLLEPLYLEEESFDGEDHVCRVTFQMCIDTKGFVAPDAVEAVRTALLLGAVTDTRAYFWEQSHAKQKSKFRQSKRYSELFPEQQPLDGLANLPGQLVKGLGLNI